MPAVKAHVWTFRSQFRAGAFGWQSDLPIKRIQEAVAEIKKTARNDRVLAAEGAVTRATRDLATSNPEFARTVGLAALNWLLCGYGYDITTLDIVNALDHTLEAARNSGSEADTMCKIQGLVDQHPGADSTIVALLRRKLGEVTSEP